MQVSKTQPLVLLTVCLVQVCTQKCDQFNLKVEYRIGSNITNNITFAYDCLGPKLFANENVTAIYINEKLRKLDRNFVADLPDLTVFATFAQDLSEVQPGAFKNVPNLSVVSFRQGSLREVFRGTFDVLPKLEFLRISNHQIYFIEDRAFANLVALKRVLFQYNNLFHWNREWFTNSTHVENLSFSSNKIQNLPKRAFAELPDLKHIDFSYNEIGFIDTDAFLGLKYVETLSLAHNRLKTIPEEVFPNKLSIRDLSIHANRLNFLPNEVLKKIQARKITLYGNPWKCPCLERITYWLYENKGEASEDITCTSPDIPICMYPKSFARTCIETVDEQVTEEWLKELGKRPELLRSCANA